MDKLLLNATQGSSGGWSLLLGTGNNLLLTMFVVQAGLALLATAIALLLLPVQYRKQKQWTAIYLFVLSFAIPLGGLFICMFVLLMAYRFPLKREPTNIGEVKLPLFELALVDKIKHGGGARLRILLDNAKAPVSERMTALLAMQAIPKHTASPILRAFLRDSVEDVRLLMYGMLDGAEKKITQQIHAELPKLAALSTDGDANERYQVNFRLATFYWELIYQNLVQDDIYTYTAGQVEHYAKAALEIKPDSASLWFMRGRLALNERQADLADTYLERAAIAGFPHDRLLPLFAESAYLRREYAQVKARLNTFQNSSSLPLLQPLQSYWTS